MPFIRRLPKRRKIGQEMSKKIERNSGIELLRIVCMFLIIAGHYSFFGNTGIPQNSITCQIYFVQCLGAFGRVSCGVFALISGYYLCQKKTTISRHIVHIIPLILKLQFYSMVILLFTWSFHLVPVTLVAAIKAMLPLFWGNWYVVYYIIIYCFSPFINQFVDTLDQKQYCFLITLIVVVWGIVPLISAHAWSFSMFDFFLACYLIGGYLFRFGNPNPNKRKCVALIVLCVLLMFGSIAVIDAVGLTIKSETVLRNYNYFGEYSSVLAIPLEISLFYLFRGFSFHNKTVNCVASHVVGIYLIHENEFMRTWLWSDLFLKTEFIRSWMIIFHAFFSVLSVFAICLIIDYLCSATIERLSNAWLERNGEKIISTIEGLTDRVFTYANHLY